VGHLVPDGGQWVNGSSEQRETAIGNDTANRRERRERHLWKWRASQGLHRFFRLQSGEGQASIGARGAWEAIGRGLL